MIRAAKNTDLVAVAKIHKSAYSRKHFMSLLPEKTLVYFYGLFISPDTRFIVYVDDCDLEHDAIQGFAVFGQNMPERIEEFKRKATVDILRTGVAWPFVFFNKFIKIILTKTQKRSPYPPARWLLLSIAVTQNGCGIGRALLNAMINDAEANKVAKVGLYVNVENLQAINAYASAGFRIKDLVCEQYYMERIVLK